MKSWSRNSTVIPLQALLLLALTACLTAFAQPGDVVELLKRRYTPAILFSPPQSLVALAGATLTVRRSGLKGSPTFTEVFLPNYFAAGGSVIQPEASGRRVKRSRIPTEVDIPEGTTVYVIDLLASDDTLMFQLQTRADLPPEQLQKLRAALTIRFPKGVLRLDQLEEVYRVIDEVLTVSEPAPAVLGRYVYTANPDFFVQLNEDGSFTFTQGNGTYSGRFSVNEGSLERDNNLQLAIQETGTTAFLAIRPGKILDPAGTPWVRQGAEPVASPEPASPVPAAESSGIVHRGQTQDEIKALLGAPDKIENANGKTVFLYSGMTITFTNGRVESVR